MSRVELQIPLNFSGIDKSSAEIATSAGILAVFSWTNAGLDLVANQRNNVRKLSR